MSFEEQLGIKFPVLVSGLIGGIIALTFEEKLSFFRALLIIFTGAATAAYTNASVMHYFSIPELYSNFIGFVTGLVAMKITIAISKIAQRLAENPFQFLKILIGKSGNNSNPTDDVGNS